MNFALARADRQDAPIRCKGQRRGPADLECRLMGCPRREIPASHFGFTPAGGEQPAVRRKCETFDGLLARQLFQQFPGLGVPHLDEVTMRDRAPSQPVALGGQPQGRPQRRPHFESRELFAGGKSVDLHDALLWPRHERQEGAVTADRA